MITLILTGILIIAIGVYYAKIKWKLTYWRRNGIEQADCSLFEMGNQFTKTYFHCKKKGLRYGGSYLFFNPRFVPVDLDLIKNILIADFGHFANHGTKGDEKKDPLSVHLFNLENDRWKLMRAKVSPTFTSGKMKMMFQTVGDSAPGLVNIFEEYAKLGDPIDVKDVLARFTTDVIGSVAFGIECDSIKNPNSEFRVAGKTLIQNVGLLMMLFAFLPRFIGKLLMSFKKNKKGESPSEFYMRVVNDMVHYRETNNIHRNDFLHLLLQLKNRGQVFDDEKIFNDSKQTTENNLTINELAAQCYVFFLGGFETSSTTMTFALYELAENQDVQDKLRKEIKETLAKNNGKMTYEVVMKMEYLEKVINETLRLHPAVRFLLRECNKDYEIPDSNDVIKAGEHLVIPVEAIHKDPDHFPDPERFDPERFSPENKAGRHKLAFMPFGEGPRMCIGSRFAYLQTKVGLASILSQFRVSLSSKTPTPLIFDDNFMIQQVKGELFLNVEKIN